MLTRDFISAKERLSDPLKKWVSEIFKDFILSAVLITSFLVIITQPGGFF